MAESHDEVVEMERKIIKDKGMSEDRYRERADELEQEGLDRENVRTFVSMFSNQATRTEDVKVLEIKKVCSSREELLSAIVQRLISAGVPLENRIRKKESRRTQRRQQQIYSLADCI